MKKTLKKFLATALTMLLVFSVSVTAFAADITEDKAKQIALNDAGYTADDAVYIRAEFDFDDGMKLWEVEFHVKDAEGYYLEYDYAIRASDGKIIEKERDFEDDYFAKTPKKQKPTESVQPTEGPQPAEPAKQEPRESAGSGAALLQAAVPVKSAVNSEISAEDAKKAAAEAFGFNVSEVSFLEIRKDYDDGIPVYEIEFRKDFDAKYSCDVVIASGDVRDKDTDISISVFDKLELAFEALIFWIVSLFIK